MSELLEKVNTPDDLDGLKADELNRLAEEIRDYLIETISKTGGHLASNLGVVELTVALHRHLKSPRDSIIWDVGHQSYTHKILTGRKKELSTIRQGGGLSGFPKRDESEHDKINTGHSSTSISSALGMARARDHRSSEERVYCVIGDGAITGGMAMEALNHAGHVGTDLTVILNDNEMSISKNVGALSSYLSKLRSEPGLRRLKEDMSDIVDSIPGIGSSVSRTVDKAKDSVKYMMVPGIIFEELGFTYLGPVSGHDIESLQKVFKQADKISGPVLIHAATVKGKGYCPAEDEPCDYHGVSSFEIESGSQNRSRENPTYSDVFGETLSEMGETDIRIVGITAAMPAGTGLEKFADRFPNRFYDVGIAEQHALTFGAGLARGGMRPVVSIYSTFLQRGYDQVIHDICLQELPVIIGIDRAGIVGGDGETHQGQFDISFLRAIPNLTMMAPRDEAELARMMWTAYKLEKPAAIRYPRGEGEGVDIPESPDTIPTGEGERLREGEDVEIIALGSMVYPALAAAELLEEQGISAGVFDARFIQPLDDKILEIVSQSSLLVTAEENAVSGGFGSLIVEKAGQADINLPDSFINIGLPDEFIPHGDQQKMRRKYGLDAESIAGRISSRIKGDGGRI
ncbi:1-deoxy-D-xylulose-5-phosphate synthase [Halarsenatibacter silvermanii]|uniref:1-deoxy-D-xylulose-5-phosphate synthase n=1 Tax=Halarsenatibacter silvermanii TaxID=321763 RepID=A0A1G9PN43_9FIRM|nr:1-deoxy-D-xylulose-5-phosphate synthase [Halarsenatibacter silvermanii]SDL99495.1 1-deoxy-D-xylulose-5-phosphate synthase [Halarsenatibacter silvermanii]